MSSLPPAFQRTDQLKPRLPHQAKLDIENPLETQDRPRLSSKPSGFFKNSFTLTPRTRPKSLPRPASADNTDVRSLSNTLSRLDIARLYESGQRARYVTGGPPTDIEFPLSLSIETAILWELLNVPCYDYDSSLRGKAVRRGTAVGRAASVLEAVLHGHHESRSLRDQPDQNDTLNFTLTPKLLVVTEAGFVLQYSSEGHPDRLPEKILSLRPSTIAVASDALSGKHWVLSIVGDACPTHKKEFFSLSNLRPRLPSWSSTSKVEAAELLLVFDESLQFERWLITLRKEIEALGGLQYRPDSCGLDGELERFGDTPSPAADTSVVFSAAPFKCPTRRMQSEAERASTSCSPRSKQFPAPARYRNSSADSSLTNAIELDYLQKSSSLERNFTCGTRSSYDALLPAHVISIHSPTLQGPTVSDGIGTMANFSTSLGRRRPPPIALPVANTSRKRSSSCSAALPSPQLNRTPTIPTHDLDAFAGRFAPRTYTEIHTPIEAEKMGHWLDSVTKAREIANDDPVTPKQHVHRPSNANLCPDTTDSQRSSELPSSSEGDRGAQQNSYMPGTPNINMSPGIGDSTAHHPTPTPTCRLVSQRSSPPQVTSFDSKAHKPQSLEHLPACKSLNLPMLSLRAEGVAEHTSLVTKSQSRYSSKNSQRKSLCLITSHNEAAIDQTNKPDTSSAVNNAHTAICSGITAPSEKQSIRARSEFLDSPTTANTLEFPPSPALQQAVELHVRNTAPPRQQKLPTRQRSMRDIPYRADDQLNPPPTKPLPAVPAQSLTPEPLQVQYRRDKSASPRRSVSKTGSDGHPRRESFARADRSPPASNPVVDVVPAGRKSTRHVPASLQLPSTRPALTRAPAAPTRTVSEIAIAVSPTTLSNLAAAISAVAYRPQTRLASEQFSCCRQRS